jgi:N-acetylmuramoyl-L-alanine amidase
MLVSYAQKDVLTINTVMRNKIIAIDPGHGGVDGGASLSQEFHEKNINLDIALKLREHLEEAGAKVVMTRESDVSLEKMSSLASSRYRRDLDARQNIINSSGADIFISIHSNCFRSSPSTRGAIVFYRNGSDEGHRLAGLIGRSIDEIVYRDFLKTDSISTKILPQDLYILRNTRIPGALVEAGYMTHWEEGKLLRQDSFKAAISQAIYDGLLNYCKNENEANFISAYERMIAKLVKYAFSY